MKTIFEHAIGGDGGMAGLYLDGANVEVKISYPTAMVVSPITDLIDRAINSIEAAIPGDWDKAVLEPIRLAAKAELLALLSGG